MTFSATTVLNLATLRKLIFLELDKQEQNLQNVITFIGQNHFEDSPELNSLINSINKAEQENPSGLKFSFTSIHTGTHSIYHSAFLSIYSFIEYSLKITSQYVAFQDKVSVRKVNNMEKMYQYFDFLAEQMKLDRSLIEEEWRTLTIYKDIRNSIAHHNSTIGKNISTISEAFLKTYPGIELKATGLFCFKNEQVLVDLINTGRSFFSKLFDALEVCKK